MYYSLLSLTAQITVLVSLVRAPFSDYNILYWYIANYIAGSLIIINNLSIDDSKEDHRSKYILLTTLAFVGNFITTVLFIDEAWCGAAPSIVTLCIASALDLQIQKHS